MDRHVNTFSKGMQVDLDKEFSPKDSYRYSKNGSVFFNTDGTVAWQFKSGNRLSVSIDSTIDTNGNYIPIGKAEFGNKAVIFQANEVDGYSEIGLLIVDTDGISQYKTLFNDSNDIEKLNFSTTNQIESILYYESDSIIRVYWGDGVKDDSNPFRTYTFKFDGGDKESVLDYSGVTDSVHGINSTSEAEMGIIKYVERIDGSLPSGMYRYSYRLGLDEGYATPWMPLTDTLFVTTDEIDSNNWNQYEMESVGATTNKGNQIEVVGIDQRFDYIEVLGVHIVSEANVDSAVIFSKKNISSDIMEFDHVSQDGQRQVSPASINNQLIILDGIRTLQTKKNNLYVGNVKEENVEYDIEAILANVTVQPKFRDMRSDENGYTGTVGPITNQQAKTVDTIKTIYNGANESYAISGDYVNYKGTQVFNLYKGFFRGETYRLGIKIFSKRMGRSFVYHLADMRMPEQYELTYDADRITVDGNIVSVKGPDLADPAYVTNDYNSRNNETIVDGDARPTNLSYIKLMGVEVSGLDFSSCSDDISGFEIVRCVRDELTIAQGLVQPTVLESALGNNQEVGLIMPIHTQQWRDTSTLGSPTSSTDVDNIELLNINMNGGRSHNPPSGGSINTYVINPHGVSSMMVPDLNVLEGASRINTLQANDKIALVGGCMVKENPTYLQDIDTSTEGKKSSEVFAKMYVTANEFHRATCGSPYPRFGETIEPEETVVVQDDDRVEDFCVAGVDMKNATAGNDFNGNYGLNEPNQDHEGMGLQNHLMIKHGDVDKRPNTGQSNVAPYFGSSDAAYGSNVPGCFIGNYRRDKSSFYGGKTSTALENSVFISVGQFVPVNNSSFVTPSGYVYDNVEVWGGDCFLDYVGVARVYGDMDSVDAGENFALGHGVVFPLESKFCYSLRNAQSSDNPMYSDAGLRRWANIDGTLSNFWDRGVFIYEEVSVYEEFSIQASLLYQDNLQNSPGLLDVDNFNNKFPTRWRYSPVKINGDEVDVWRQFQANDFRDMDGSSGEITSSAKLFEQLYSFQEYGFARLRAYDRTQTVDPILGVLQLGDGTQLDGYDYINQKHGNQHQWSLITTDKAIYWCDVNSLSICRFSQNGFEPISMSKSQHQSAISILRNLYKEDNPVNNSGIAVGYDPLNTRVFWSFNTDRVYAYKGNETFVITKTRVGVGTEILVNDGDLVTINAVAMGGTFYHGDNYLVDYYLYVEENDMTFDLNGVLYPIVAGVYYQVSYNSIDGYTVEPVADSKELNVPSYNGLIYNESQSQFETWIDYQFMFALKVGSYMLERNIIGSNDLYVDDLGSILEFYGNDKKAILDIVANPSPIHHSIFDNAQIFIDRFGYQALNNVDCITETQYQNIQVVSDNRYRYKENVARFPTRGYNQKDRVRGKALTLRMKFNKLNEYIAKITAITTKFRVSNRI